jgi:hypothetical protein
MSKESNAEATKKEGLFTRLNNKFQYRKAKWQFRNRSVTRAKVLYWYFIFGGLGGFLYAISCIFTGFPYWYALSPVLALIGFFVLFMLGRNWKLIWMYIRDTEQGRLLLSLNKNTHYSEAHKFKLIKWVYLRRKTIRNERWLELSEKERTGNELSKDEKREIRYTVVSCPQQLLDGVNKAILVHVLIEAHLYIHLLDDNLRKIMELTDANMVRFDLQAEVNRCRTKESRDKIKKMEKKGLEIIKNRKK